MAISFFVTAYVARYLGPENYGQLGYAISFVSIFSFIATLGIDQALFRDLIKFPEKTSEYMGTAFVLKLIAAFVATLAATASAFYLSPPDISRVLIIIISTSFIFSAFNIIAFEFQARVESKFPSIILILTAVILSITKLLVIYYDKGIIFFSLVLLLEAVLYALFYVVYRIKNYGPIFHWKFNKVIAISLLKDSWPLMFASAFTLIYARIDQVLIKNMIDTTSVGLYDAAVRLSEIWYFIPNILLGSLFPAIINAKKVSDESYYRRLKYLAYVLFGFSILIAIPFTLFSSQIMFLVFGSAYVAGHVVLQIYIWSGIGTSLAHLTNHFLIAENYRKIIFISSLIAMVTNVVLNILLIPQYGIIGSAWATFISYMLTPLFLLVFKETRSKVISIFKS
jgi:O-antigen/teichoic acid export membrane protein